MSKKIFAISIVLFFTGCIKVEQNLVEYQLVGSCRLPGYPKDLDFYAHYAVIADDQGGLVIVDIQDPSNPQIVTQVNTQTRFVGVAVRDTFAYVASLDRGGLKIFSISDPLNPIELGQDPSFLAYKIFAPQDNPDIVYIAAGYWFHVQLVNPPLFTSYVKRWSVPGNVRSVYLVDSLAFLASEQMGVYVYNVNGPSQQIQGQVGHIDTPGNARDIFVCQNYAFVADGLKGLCILKVSQPESLKIVASYDTRGYAQGVFVKDSICYVADREGGLVTFDVSNPENPKLYGIYPAPYTYSVRVRDSLIYLLDRDYGLLILREVK